MLISITCKYREMCIDSNCIHLRIDKVKNLRKTNSDERYFQKRNFATPAAITLREREKSTPFLNSLPFSVTSVLLRALCSFPHLLLYTRILLSLNRKKGILISSLLMAMRCKHGCILVCLPFFYPYNFESPRQINCNEWTTGHAFCLLVLFRSLLPCICKSARFPRFCKRHSLSRNFNALRFFLYEVNDRWIYKPDSRVNKKW